MTTIKEWFGKAAKKERRASSLATTVYNEKLLVHMIF
jgi:hypothetical protein